MVLKMLVYARTRFVAFHRWEDAPKEFEYLSRPHRHNFHVEVGVRVKLVNREVEFHLLKSRLNGVIQNLYSKSIQSSILEPEPIESSCELIASAIASGLRSGWQYDIAYVDVSEDGECGGRVEYE